MMTGEEAIEELKKGVPQQWDWHRDRKAFKEAIEMGIEALKLIPDNATNGDVIKALFPNGNQIACEPIMKYEIDNYAYEFSYEWWNALYRKE